MLARASTHIYTHTRARTRAWSTRSIIRFIIIIFLTLYYMGTIVMIIMCLRTQIRIVTTRRRPLSCRPLLDHEEFNELCVLYLYTFIRVCACVICDCVHVRPEDRMHFSVSHPTLFPTVHSAWKRRRANCFLDFFFMCIHLKLVRGKVKVYIVSLCSVFNLCNPDCKCVIVIIRRVSL